MEVGSSASSYEILAKLAEGGMAEIFLARSTTGAGVERMVVLKRVLRHAAMDEQLVRLFVQEARLAAQLQHPNVVQVYDVGKLGSSYFFSMEYVHGETVRDLLLHARHHRVTLPIATVMTLAAGAAAGLSHAHERRGLNGKPLNIVHADISPSNLMVTREGVVKIVDFGIAKAEHATVTESETAVQGKLCYMSPEQVRSQPLDRRSDLFSLGIVLWELLTLQGLFRADSDFNVMDMIISQPTPAPSQLRNDVPRDVDEIVLRLLAKNPANRYQSAAELLDAIEVAAMRMQTLLSTASVARQMREWFGERPEPWIEQTVGGSVKRVVVASEPVPKDLSQTIAGPLSGIDAVLDTMPPTILTPPPSSVGAPSWDTETIESLEAMRDRLFREARERKTPQPGTPATGAPPGAFIVESRKAREEGHVLPSPLYETLKAGPPVDGRPGAPLPVQSGGRATPPGAYDAGRASPPSAYDAGRASPPTAYDSGRNPAYDAGRASPPTAYDSDRDHAASPAPYPQTTAGFDSGPTSVAPPRTTGRRSAQPQQGPPGAFGNPATRTDVYPRDSMPRWRPRERKSSWIGLVLLAVVITLGIGGITFALLWKSQLSETPAARDAGPASVGDASVGSAAIGSGAGAAPAGSTGSGSGAAGN